MESLLERRQMMVEQEEADSVAQLQFVEEKQMVADVFARQPDGKIAVDAEAALMAAAAKQVLLERRQMLIEEEEANSLQQLQYVAERQKLEETRQVLFNFETQMQAVQDSVEEAVEQTLTAGEEFARSLPGAVPFIGYFDPLGILTGSSKEKVQYYRDAELKHGRIGTLAAIGIIVSENYHPLAGSELDKVPAIFAFQHNMLAQTLIVASAAALASRPQQVPQTERKQTTEIWHVRGGMLAAFGMIAKEAVTSTCFCF
jgi:hypothetical protein